MEEFKDIFAEDLKLRFPRLFEGAKVMKTAEGLVILLLLIFLNVASEYIYYWASLARHPAVKAGLFLVGLLLMAFHLNIAYASPLKGSFRYLRKYTTFILYSILYILITVGTVVLFIPIMIIFGIVNILCLVIVIIVMIVILFYVLFKIFFSPAFILLRDAGPISSLFYSSKFTSQNPYAGSFFIGAVLILVGITLIPHWLGKLFAGRPYYLLLTYLIYFAIATPISLSIEASTTLFVAKHLMRVEEEKKKEESAIGEGEENVS